MNRMQMVARGHLYLSFVVLVALVCNVALVLSHADDLLAPGVILHDDQIYFNERDQPDKNPIAACSNITPIDICLALGPAASMQKRRKADDSDTDDSDTDDSETDDIVEEEICEVLVEIAEFLADDPKRVKIIKALSLNPMTCFELKTETGISKSTMDRHLKVLEMAGFVKKTDEWPAKFARSEFLDEFLSLAEVYCN